jgi:hypothetical protein
MMLKDVEPSVAAGSGAPCKRLLPYTSTKIATEALHGVALVKVQYGFSGSFDISEE